MTQYSLASVLTKMVGLTSLIGFVPPIFLFIDKAYNYTKLFRFDHEHATLDQLFGWDVVTLVWIGLCAWLCLCKTEWVVTRILRITNVA
jgi:hypothetical protein